MTSHAPLPFTLRQLQYAVAIADTGSFRAAAESCAVAQPSLSAQIATLESALGTPLFERRPRGVALSQAGARLLPRMRALLLGAGELGREAATLGDPFGGLWRIGLIPTVAPYLLPTLAPALLGVFPSLRPQWVEAPTADLVQRLQDGELEAAILAAEADLGGMEEARLGWEPFHLLVAADHPLSQSEGPVALEALTGSPLLLLEEGHCLRHQALAACTSSRVEEAGFRATSLSTLVHMVGSGLGVTLLPRMALPLDGALATVKALPLAAPTPGRTLVLIWRPSFPGADALRTLAEVIRRAAFPG